jgi:hypothetical protein
MSDFLNQDKDFPYLVSQCVNIMNAMKGTTILKGEEWMTYSEGIGTKLLGHLVNMYSLYMGTNIKFNNDQTSKFIDFASINILSRAAWETYLCYYFIFIDPESKSEREFRFLIWDLAGYLERQGFNVELAVNRVKKMKELEDIEKLKERIKVHPKYLELTPNEQNKVLNSNWKFGKKIPELAKIAGFDEEHFGTIYSFLCGYSHNSRNSVMQVYYAKDHKTQQDLSKPEIAIATIILSNFIRSYSILHPHLSKMYNDNKLLKKVSEAWIAIGKGMKSSKIEVFEFVSERLLIDIKSLNLSTSFAELNMNEKDKLELLMDYGNLYFMNFTKGEVDSVKTMDDFIQLVMKYKDNI